MVPIPPDWKTLNVVRDLGTTRTDGNLVIHRTQKGTEQIYARWLPHEEDDPRPRSRDLQGRLKKRLPYEKSMKTTDPIEAGKRAVSWLKELKRQLLLEHEQQQYDSEHSLERYWEQWWSKEEVRLLQKSQGKGSNRIRDEKSKWTAQDWGIGNQTWSKKKIDQINYQDLEGYWAVLDSRATARNDMVGTKKQQKTLINKIFLEAQRSNMPSLRKPDFPTIESTRSKQAVPHLRKDQWEELLRFLVDNSGGLANKKLSQEEYRRTNLDPRNNKCQRNWIDLYDSCLFLWFFYGRSTDLNVLTSEMLAVNHGKNGMQEAFLTLEQDKSNRDILTTTSYREDSVRFVHRLKARKPKGYALFPSIIRPKGSPKDSNLLEKANLLLQHAIREIGMPGANNFRMTEIRHTAFRLTLEDRPILGQKGYIDEFARNGHTSPEMLEKNYLRYIRVENQARELRVPQSSEYTLVRRVNL
jgi:hypothetical protein